MAPDYYRVHNLNTGLTYTKIQDAIDATETLNGHTIFVETGIYNEHVVLNKSILLVGDNEGTTVVDGDSAGNVINITAGNVEITRLKVQRSGSEIGDCGIFVLSNNSIISYCDVVNNTHGVVVWNSSGNTIFLNNLVNNTWAGLWLESSSKNAVIGNDFSNDDTGIYFNCSLDNIIYHNSFVNNGNHLVGPRESEHWPNTFDNGFEGNYWLMYYYIGADSNRDGIIDNPLEVVGGTDHYPLAGTFHDFNTSVGYHVNVLSNSTVEDFEYFDFNRTIRFQISNTTVAQTSGFCRICIPHILISPDKISVTIDNEETPILYENHTLYDNGTHRWIYFAYEHSTHEVIILPEHLSQTILPLFMIAALLAVIVYRRKHALTVNRG